MTMNQVEARVRCPDEGYCHHGCTPGTKCWRVEFAAPLSDVGETWESVLSARPLVMDEDMLRQHLEHLESMAFEYVTINPNWHHETSLPFGQQSSYHRREFERYAKARKEVTDIIMDSLEVPQWKMKKECKD